MVRVCGRYIIPPSEPEVAALCGLASDRSTFCASTEWPEIGSHAFLIREEIVAWNELNSRVPAKSCAGMWRRSRRRRWSDRHGRTSRVGLTELAGEKIEAD